MNQRYFFAYFTYFSGAILFLYMNKWKTLSTERINWLVLVAFSLIGLGFYAPVYQAGMVSDFTGLQERLETGTFWGVFSNLGFPALEQVVMLIYWIWDKLFDIQPIAWFGLFVGLHIANAFCLFYTWATIFKNYQVADYQIIAILAGLLFLLCPYHTEPVVWKVCVNFLLSTLLLQVTFYFSFQYFQQPTKNNFWKVAVSYLLALFSFELALIFPLLFFALCLFDSRFKQKKGDFQGIFARFVVFFGISFWGYFVLNKWLFGHWIGHYGAAVHLKFDLKEILVNYFNYFERLALFSRYFPFPIREKLVLFNTQYYSILTFLGVLCLIFYLFRFHKLKNELKIALWVLLLFFIALTPIINIYFSYLQRVENDRYCYFASLFFSLAFVLVCFSMPKWIRYGFIFIFLGLNSYFLNQTLNLWKASDHIYKSLLNDFRWYDKDYIFVLSSPENLDGTPIFRDYSKQPSDFGISHALKYVLKKPYKGRIYEVAQYNLTSLKDGVRVERLAENEYKIAFNQWGNWFWRKGKGATNYENEFFAIEMIDFAYILKIKQIPNNAVFIYQDGLEWKELKF